jgi:hypothetical protein
MNKYPHYKRQSVAGSPFAVDWSDKDAVIAYAKKLGEGMIVISNPMARNQFAISFVEHSSRYEPDQIVFTT